MSEPQAKTPSLEAYLKAIEALPVTRTWHVYGDEPTIRIVGQPAHIEIARVIARDGDLHTAETGTGTYLEISGFERSRPARPLNLSQRYCSGCGDELILTQERMAGLCGLCEKAEARS
jgi:hypothetical protein